MLQTLKFLSERINKNPEKTYIKITDYVKEVGGYRITEGKSDVIVDVTLKPYIERLKDSKKIVEQRENDASFIQSMKNIYGVKQEEIDEAFDEVKTSLMNSITKAENPQDQDDSNTTYYGNGMIQHNETKKIYVTGQVIHEDVKVEATYKEKKSKTKTLLKNMISKNLPHEVQRFSITEKELTKLSLVSESQLKLIKG